MRKRILGWVLTLVLFLSLIVVTVAPGLAQADDPYPSGAGLPVVTDNAYGLIIGAALIVVIIFGGVAFRRWKS